ncbi:hypothetical protein ACGF1Z_31315 [Streptomyces sp. NPDC048018]|uniref:hypothetical protein n=1 Tax=Streptomyces sp. NPDC048018 TaxID=3365499 RepID=UPI00371E99C2
MTDQTLRREIAEALLARIKQAVVEPARPWSGATTSLLAATEYDLADAVLAVRDAARQATGQPAADEAPFPACGSHSLPISTGELVRCVLVTGHAGQCQSATDFPYVSWPNPSNGVWNPAAGLAACGCGEPGTSGVVHRPDGPCYVDDTAAGLAAPTNHDTETRAAVLREAADAIDATFTGFGIDRYVRHGADLLRRMAAGAES